MGAPDEGVCVLLVILLITRRRPAKGEVASGSLHPPFSASGSDIEAIPSGAYGPHKTIAWRCQGAVTFVMSN